MTSRVTFNQLNSVVMNNLFKNYKELAKTQERLSSGKAINRPSDAPIEITNDLELRSNIDQMNQYRRNINDADSYMAILDTTMQSSNNVLQNVREIAIQGANDTLTAENRSYLNNDVKQSLYQLVTLSNSVHKGDYLFSGKFTDQPPYSLEDGEFTADDAAAHGAPYTLNESLDIWDQSVTDSTLPEARNLNPLVARMVPGEVTVFPSSLEEGTDYSIDYVNGRIQLLSANAVTEADAGTLRMEFEWVRRSEADLNGDVNRATSVNVKDQINITADEMFGNRRKGETDAFSSVISLMEGLHESVQPAIEESISNIDTSFHRMLSAQATTGARVNGLEMTDGRLGDKVIEATDQHSKIEDLDFAQAISDFMLQEAVYNASLQSAARVLQPSLVDFV